MNYQSGDKFSFKTLNKIYPLICTNGDHILYVKWETESSAINVIEARLSCLQRQTSSIKLEPVYRQ